MTLTLAGWSGTLMADGYQAYDGLGPGVLRVSCLAHIRRRFHDIVRCGRGPGLLARAQAPVAWEAIDVFCQVELSKKSTGN